MVKIIDRFEKARLAASCCLLRLPFSAASIRPTIQLLLNSINREEQNGLGSHAGLHHRHRRSRAAVAERISGCGEPHPESPDQGPAAPVEVLTLKGLVTYYVMFFIQLESRRVCLAGITQIGRAHV